MKQKIKKRVDINSLKTGDKFFFPGYLNFEKEYFRLGKKHLCYNHEEFKERGLIEINDSIKEVLIEVEVDTILLSETKVGDIIIKPFNFSSEHTKYEVIAKDSTINDNYFLALIKNLNDGSFISIMVNREVQLLERKT